MLYSSEEALKRLRSNLCPECGFGVSRHGGWGGPNGCLLTDNGVARLIHEQHQKDQADSTSE